MRNTLGDLNNHLFAQLEKLGEDDLTGNELVEELERTKAIMSVANQIISNGSLVLKATTVRDDRTNVEENIPKMLEG